MTDDPEKNEHSIEDLAHHLRELGSESETERTVKRIVPWVTSVAFHASLIFLAFVFVFAPRMFREDEEPLVVVADFDNLNYEPVAMLNPNQAQENQETLQDRVRTESLSQTLTDQLRDLEMDRFNSSPTQPARRNSPSSPPSRNRAPRSSPG